MLGWSLNLFRVRGIQLAVHFTFFLLLAYFAYDGWTDAGWTGLCWSAGLLVACFTCVVLHELGHSFTAQHFGVGVSRILLMPIGGMAQFDRIPRRPRHELLITLAGPAVNFVIAGMLFLVLPFPDGWMDNVGSYTLSGALHELLLWNVMMGCFNLLPAFPMDGGRILRASLASRMTYLTATTWAATIGKVVSVIGAIAGIYFEMPVTVCLFTFIFVVGEMELRAVRGAELVDAEWKRILARANVPSTEEPPLLSN